LGATRFTDPERNIIVASTDFPELSKSPLGAQKNFDGMTGDMVGALEHYSYSSRVPVWGTDFVYKDNLVTEERFQLKISYRNNNR